MKTEFNTVPQLQGNGLSVVELFCGGGIGAVGIKAAGFDIVKAFDFDKDAVDAYRHNFGDHVSCSDINDIPSESIPGADVIFGGPPCQDYSNAGNRKGDTGENGKMVYKYLDIISVKKPKVFVFENVKALASKRFEDVFANLIEAFKGIGYRVSWRVLNAWDYGVSQRRERLFVVGFREDLGVDFSFPQPIPDEYRTQTLRSTLRGLSDASDYYYIHPRNYARRGVIGLDEAAPTIRTQNRPMPAGYPGHVNDANYNDGCPLGHPRRFSVRESLRIQSVPDFYQFPASISTTAQYRIVGNGIPSKIAWYISKAIAEQLMLAKSTQMEAEY